jgi:hypothetical protein
MKVDSLLFPGSLYNPEERLLVSLGLFVRPSVRAYQFGSYWKNFRRSLHWRFQLKSIEEIQVRLKFGHNGLFTWRLRQVPIVDSRKKIFSISTKTQRKNYSYFSITTLNNVKILKNNIYLKMQTERIVAFQLQQCLLEVLQYYVIRALAVLLWDAIVCRHWPSYAVAGINPSDFFIHQRIKNISHKSPYVILK